VFKTVDLREEIRLKGNRGRMIRRFSVTATTRHRLAPPSFVNHERLECPEAVLSTNSASGTPRNMMGFPRERRDRTDATIHAETHNSDNPNRIGK
jgi:hypothetical protein